jgi:hypothetical protein
LGSRIHGVRRREKRIDDLVRRDWRGRGVSHDFALAGAFRRCPCAPAAPGDAVALRPEKALSHGVHHYRRYCAEHCAAAGDGLFRER